MKTIQPLNTTNRLRKMVKRKRRAKPEYVLLGFFVLCAAFGLFMRLIN